MTGHAATPPEWATRDGVRLDLREFGIAFAKCWRSASSGASKVEVWQTYQEPGTQSLRAFERGEFGKVRALVIEEAELDGFVYDDIRGKGRLFTRFRLVKLPLSEYLEYEFWNYRVRAGLGEVVRIVNQTSVAGSLPSSDHFDFLLFDDEVALIHDYGTDGLQVGGWLVASRDTLDRLSRTVADLSEHSVALEGFISAHHLTLAE